MQICWIARQFPYCLHLNYITNFIAKKMHIVYLMSSFVYRWTHKTNPYSFADWLMHTCLVIDQYTKLNSNPGDKMLHAGREDSEEGHTNTHNNFQTATCPHLIFSLIHDTLISHVGILKTGFDLTWRRATTWLKNTSIFIWVVVYEMCVYTYAGGNTCQCTYRRIDLHNFVFPFF